MAGKHSKSFFDFRKREFLTRFVVKETESTISLPFKIIIYTLVLSLLVSFVLVGNFFTQGKRNKKTLIKSQQIFASLNSDDALKELSQKNPDIKGWIKIGGTNINNVVCQGNDDSYYINHNYLGKRSRYGSLFLSHNDTFEREGNDHNIVIFGNNMKDSTMFGELKEYRKLSFYKQNPTLNLYYNDKCETYIVFAVFLTSSSTDDDGNLFYPGKSHFATEDEFSAWYNEICERSILNTTVSASRNDDLLTLVTVADDFDGARLVVMAKKVEEWQAELTDVSGASVNPKPKHPKIWYETKK